MNDVKSLGNIYLSSLICQSCKLKFDLEPEVVSFDIWPQNGHFDIWPWIVVTTLAVHQGHVIVIWPWHQGHVIVIWSWHQSHVIVIWPWHQSHVIVIWPWHQGHILDCLHDVLFSVMINSCHFAFIFYVHYFYCFCINACVITILLPVSLLNF